MGSLIESAILTPNENDHHNINHFLERQEGNSTDSYHNMPLIGTSRIQSKTSLDVIDEGSKFLTIGEEDLRKNQPG